MPTKVVCWLSQFQYLRICYGIFFLLSSRACKVISLSALEWNDPHNGNGLKLTMGRFWKRVRQKQRLFQLLLIHSFNRPFTHSSNNHLISYSCRLTIGRGTRNVVVSREDMGPCPGGIYSLTGRMKSSGKCNLI